MLFRSVSGFGSGLKNSARVTWAVRNTSGRSLIPLSTRSTSLMIGSCSTSTSRTMPRRSPVRKCWVRVLWTMLHHESPDQKVWGLVVDGTGLEQHVPSAAKAIKAPVQRRRPQPAAETGRSCWGRVLIFQSPAKGLRKNQLTQPVALISARFPTHRNVYQERCRPTHSSRVFLFWWTVQDENRDKQRQGITMRAISCLLIFLTRRGILGSVQQIRI